MGNDRSLRRPVGRGRVPFRVVARFLAPAALLAVLAAAALAVAGTGRFGDEEVDPRADGPGRQLAAPVSPALRPVSDLALPGGPGQLDLGVGVYQALARPEQLAFPGAAAVERARRFAGSREGDVAFAVADDRGGVRGMNVHRPFPSASLSKAMMLVAFLRGQGADGEKPTDSDLLTLGYMIRLSDNASANTIYSRVGDKALLDLARRAGMQGFQISGDWANSTVTAADQARFFLSLDRLVPGRHRELARDLLENVSELQSWGIPAAARPRWRVFFKGGWRPDNDGELVHQAALLESGSRRAAIAVMSIGNPNMVYGEDSIRGVTAQLLSGAAATVPLRTGPAAPLQELGVLATGK